LHLAPIYISSPFWRAAAWTVFSETDTEEVGHQRILSKQIASNFVKAYMFTINWISCTHIESYMSHMTSLKWMSKLNITLHLSLYHNDNDQYHNDNVRTKKIICCCYYKQQQMKRELAFSKLGLNTYKLIMK